MLFIDDDLPLVSLHHTSSIARAPSIRAS
jgi:hypothetical protein